MFETSSSAERPASAVGVVDATPASVALQSRSPMASVPGQRGASAAAVSAAGEVPAELLVEGDFAEALARVDGTEGSEDPGVVVSAIAGAQAVVNHCEGRLVQLAQGLYVTYRRQLLLEDVRPADPDDLEDFDGDAVVEEVAAEDPDWAMRVEQNAARMVTAEVAAAVGWSPREASWVVRRWLDWDLAPATGSSAGDAAIGQAPDQQPDADQPDADQPDGAPAAEQATGEQPSADGLLVQEMVAGRLEARKAGVIASGVMSLSDPEDQRRVCRLVLPQAPQLPRRRIGQLVESLVLRLDPTAAEQRHTDRVRARSLDLEPGAENTTVLKTLGVPPDQAAAVYNRIDTLARRAKAGGDARTMHQLRCDLTIAMLAGTAQFRLHDDDHAAQRTETLNAAAGAVGVGGVTGASRAAGSAARVDVPGGAGDCRDVCGCTCRPGGPCLCDCGTAYSTAAERDLLDAAAARDASQNQQPGQAPPSVDAAPSDPARSLPEPDQAPSTVFPLAPGQAQGQPSDQLSGGAPQVSGDVRRLPDTVLTVPLQTLLAWFATSGQSPDGQSPDGQANLAAVDESLTDATPPPDARPPVGPPWLAPPPSSAARSGPVGVPPVQAERLGPLLDSVAYRLLAARLDAAAKGEGEWRLAVTDTRGRVVQYHALHTRTLRGLRREAMAVDQQWCVFPTCTKSALRCQADHATAYARIRETRLANVEPLCSADHTVKTAGGYRIVRADPDDPATPAGWQIVMRSGHSYPTLRSIPPVLRTNQEPKPDPEPPPF